MVLFAIPMMHFIFASGRFDVCVARVVPSILKAHDVPLPDETISKTALFPSVYTEPKSVVVSAEPLPVTANRLPVVTDLNIAQSLLVASQSVGALAELNPPAWACNAEFAASKLHLNFIRGSFA